MTGYCSSATSTPITPSHSFIRSLIHSLIRTGSLRLLPLSGCFLWAIRLSLWYSCFPPLHRELATTWIQRLFAPVINNPAFGSPSLEELLFVLCKPLRSATTLTQPTKPSKSHALPATRLHIFAITLGVDRNNVLHVTPPWLHSLWCSLLHHASSFSTHQPVDAAADVDVDIPHPTCCSLFSTPQIRDALATLRTMLTSVAPTSGASSPARSAPSTPPRSSSPSEPRSSPDRTPSLQGTRCAYACHIPGG